MYWLPVRGVLLSSECTPCKRLFWCVYFFVLAGHQLEIGALTGSCWLAVIVNDSVGCISSHHWAKKKQNCLLTSVLSRPHLTQWWFACAELCTRVAIKSNTDCFSLSLKKKMDFGSDTEKRTKVMTEIQRRWWRHNQDSQGIVSKALQRRKVFKPLKWEYNCTWSLLRTL